MKMGVLKPLVLIGFLVSMASLYSQNTTVEIPVAITGRIVLSTGADLPEPVKVAIVCRNRVPNAATVGSRRLSPELDSENVGMTMREETTSSLGGDFSFHFSLHREVPSRFQYALQQVDLTGCEVSASLRGHHSEVLHLGMRRRGDNPDVGIILLYPTKLVHPLVSVRSLKAPSKARGCLERALQELRKPESDYSEVSKELEQAVSIYPEYAAAWQLLGECRSKAGDRSGARQAFEQAMAADPDYVPPYLHLAGLDLAENRWKRVSDYSQKALELDDSLTKAQYYMAVARFSLGDSETAEKWALKVESTADAYRYPMNYYVLGAIRTQRGDLQNAAPAFRRFLELKPNAKSAPQVKTLLEQWERQGLVEASVGRRP